jgi:D-alanyl-D-alanine carboxypeptidase
MCAVFGRRRRAATAALVAMATLVACSAERQVPLALPPRPPPSSVADPPSTTQVEPIPTAPPSAPVSTAPAGTTSPTAVPTTAPSSWAAFDQALAAKLLDRGDYAVGVAVAVRGAIVHTADLGYRVAPVPVTAAPTDTSVAAPPTSAPPTTAPPSTGPPTTSPVEFGGAPAPIATNDRFRIASISKVITAIVVLQLVEAGQLGLDEAVGGRLAELVGASVSDPQVATITVRQLLSHTGGFPSYQSAFFGGRYDSCPAVAKDALARRVIAAPGARYVYSNLNFCLLGLLVEQIAGRPYEAVVNDRLLAPLGIGDMRMAPTFDSDPTAVVHPSVRGRNYMEALGAAGAWTATPADLVTILDSLDAGVPGFHPLSAATVELMRTVVPTAEPPSPDGRGYGLGMMVFGDGTFGHTGTVESTHAMVLDRSDGVTWSVLVSGPYPDSTGNLRTIFDEAAHDAGVALP